MATANLLFSMYISNIDSNFRPRRIWSNSFYDETLDEGTCSQILLCIVRFLRSLFAVKVLKSKSHGKKIVNVILTKISSGM